MSEIRNADEESGKRAFEMVMELSMHFDKHHWTMEQLYFKE